MTEEIQHPKEPRPGNHRKCYSLRVKLKLNQFPNDKWSLNTSLRHNMEDTQRSFREKIEELLQSDLEQVAD